MPFVIDAAGNVKEVASDADQVTRLQSEGRQFVGEDYARQAADRDAAQQEAAGRWGTVPSAAMGFGSGLTLGLGPAAAASITSLIDPATGQAAKRDLQALSGTTPFFAGEVAGMLAPLVFTAGEAGVARAGIGSLARATPAGLLGEAGGFAERLALRALPETTSALGSVGRGALGLAARGAAEGAILDVSHNIGKGLINDAPLTAQSLVASGAEGALLGGLLGGALGGLSSGLGKGLEAVSEKIGGKVASGGEATVLKRLGATATDVQKLTEEQGVREALKDINDLMLKPAGESFASSTNKINKVATESAESFRKVQQDLFTTLQKEAPQLVPDMGRIQARLTQEAVLPFQGTLSAQAVEKAVGRLESKLVGLGETTGTQSYGTWKAWMDARAQIAEAGKLVGNPTVSADLKSKILGVFDSELNAAIEDAGKFIGNGGLAKQLQAARAGERLAEHLADMTAAKAASEALAGSEKSLFQSGDLGNVGLSAMMGHPIAGLGMLATKGLGRMFQEAVTPQIAQKAYELSVGAKAAGSVSTVKDRISQATKTILDTSKKAGLRAGAKAATSELPKMSRDKFEQRLERTNELISPMHQEKVRQYAMAVEAAGQPKLAQEILLANMRASQYLQANMPPSMKVNQSTSLMAQPKMHGLSMDEWKFLRIDGAVKSPLSLMDKIEDGSVTREEVQAVKYVYPDIYTQMVAGVTEGIYDLKQEGKTISLEQVTNLGIVLDAPIDPVLEPSFISAVQATLQIPEQPGPAPQRNDAIDPMQLATPAEKIGT